MKRAVLSLALTGLALSAIAPTRAAEDDIKLAPGSGLEVVQANCSGCHSLDYIVMNSPFLDEAGWKASVTKMVNAFGAPVSEADQATILAYLNANYGKQK